MILTRKLSDMKDGWFIGDFEPSVLRVFGFEVCYKKHPKGDRWDTHYHEYATEYNLLTKGRMIIVDGAGIEYVFEEGDIFIVQPGTIASPIFLEDCELVIVKVPSIPGDKIIKE